ncbi:hypothetical protein DMN91_011036 [Ooceraea biroi]|uniref:Targeting protein for Xklp2 n=1 Tax=Ooceraea biroi TaxID=2015173 RepID=A0A026X2V2_OOCBI|nr:targeting protein for Xklp2 [Ooceraea biroi]EZA62351.1 Targeting protein for Xklp2 [Ooceraea biroi]RLU16967.1 hypothetical protein DMN91_011036 [Ooceraea biroi]
MGDYHAPQWIDFIENCSPQPPIKDFFDTVHSVHERPLNDSAAENAENVQPAGSQNNIPALRSTVSTKAQEDLNIIRSTPVKVISPKHRNNKETVVGETTYEQVLSDAMKKLELCKKPLRASRDVLNKVTTQHADTFKTPRMPITKSSRSVGYHSASTRLNVPHGQNSAPRAVKVNRNTPLRGTPVNPKRASVSCSLFKEDKGDVKHGTSKRPNDPVDEPKNDKKASEKHEEENHEKHEKDDNNEYNEEGEQERGNQEDATASQDDSEECGQDNVDAKTEKHNETQPTKRLGVLTWQNRRRSLHKRRSGPANNQYVSLAEAVSRFQTETPKRFRTRSTKENHAAGMTMNVSKLVQNRLKPTIPISPALMSKNRTRAVTVLSQEEREKQQMEEIKKHPIKANPIPRAVLQGPRMKVAGTTKKQATTKTASSFSQLSKKSRATLPSSFQLKATSLHHDKATSAAGPKNTVTKVLVTDPTGIIVEQEEITFFGVPKDTGATKGVTRIVPFSFEARNKDLQMKREQRLKSLQEASKTKVGFQARPAPNFSKAPTSTGKQQQILKKSNSVLPCPFSFEERDKKLPKRKEQLEKTLLDEDKRARVFRANPAPVFKPVLVRGRSREHLSIRDKSARTADKECEDQENREPNVDTESTSMQKTMSLPCIDKTPLMEKREENARALPIELHSDKRAKERREFDEKVKRKEMEDVLKHEEENRKQVEQEKRIKAELRKLTEVKARPMPVYKPMVIEKATKQLTEPQSPAFAHKLRRKQT